MDETLLNDVVAAALKAGADAAEAVGAERRSLSITVRNTFPGLNTANPLSFFIVCYGLLMAALLLMWRIRDSRFGSALQAARQNEVRVAAVGIRQRRLLES